MRFKLSVWVIK